VGKVYIHNTQDLESQYKFVPMTGGYPEGEEEYESSRANHCMARKGHRLCPRCLPNTSL
jgi:hypothetical protein